MAKWGRQSNKPSSPAEIMARRLEDRRRQLDRAGEREATVRADARNPEKWGADDQSLALPANENVVKDPELGGVRRRSNCFELLHRRYGTLSAESYAVSTRLQNDLATRFGLDGGRDFVADKVDESGAAGDHMDRRLAKARELDWMKERVGPKSWNLLMRIIEPELFKGQVRVWSAVVAEVSGEKNPDTLSALVRWALDDFALAYALLDKLPAADRVA